MLLSERFDERTISNMDVALERACRLMPLAFESYPARKFVAEKIVECASKHTQSLAVLAEVGRQVVAELAAEIELNSDDRLGDREGSDSLGLHVVGSAG